MNITKVTIARVRNHHYVIACNKTKTWTFPHPSTDASKIKRLASKIKSEKSIDPALWVLGHIMDFARITPNSGV